MTQVNTQARPQRNLHQEHLQPANFRAGIGANFSTIAWKVATIAAALFSFAALPFPLNIIAGGVLALISFIPCRANNRGGYWYDNFRPQYWFNFNHAPDYGFRRDVRPVFVPPVPPPDLRVRGFGLGGAPQPGHRAHVGFDAPFRGGGQGGPQGGPRARVGGDRDHQPPVGHNIVPPNHPGQGGPQGGLRARVGGDVVPAPVHVPPPAARNVHGGPQGGQRAQIGSD